MCESASTIAGFWDLACATASSADRTPTYVNSVPRNVISATCCIVALSSTHKTILLTWCPPRAELNRNPPARTPSNQEPRNRKPFPCASVRRHAAPPDAAAFGRRRGRRRARRRRRDRPQGRDPAAPGNGRSRGRLLRDRQGEEGQPRTGRAG